MKWRGSMILVLLFIAGLTSACAQEVNLAESQSLLEQSEDLPNWATEQELVIQQLVGPPDYRIPRDPPPAGFRVPAEYEATQAVVMTYTTFTIMLEDMASQVAAAGAEVWMIDGPAEIAGVPLDQYQVLNLDYDSVWTRDYGPIGIHEATLELGIVDTTYRHFATRPADDAIPCEIAGHAGAACYTSPLILDGGNVMTDGLGNLFMTSVTYDWNDALNIAEVDQLLMDYFGATTIHVLDYAETGGAPADGTGHIDMFAKLLGECKVLVAEATEEPFLSALNNAADYFATTECLPGQNFQVYRVPGWYEADASTWFTYTNALIINRTVLIPSYRNADNQAAMQVFATALPDYNLVLISSDSAIFSGGSVHCLAKEIPYPGSAVNRAPVAQAGPDQQAQSGDPVTLNGKASFDPDGDDIGYTWEQISGPTVTMDLNSAVPLFTAPDVVDATNLTFNLVVNDGQLDSPADTVNVLVISWNAEIASSDTPLAIPDNNPQGIESIIHVDQDMPIIRLAVGVDITHSYIGDLLISLESPAGTQKVLHDREGGSQNDINTIYEPVDFNGEYAAGDWILRIDDNYSSDTGTLNGWVLYLDLAEPIVCDTAQDCDLANVDQHDCIDGLCEIITCDPGFDDCNQHPFNGCETPLGTASDCAVCGDMCEYYHAAGECQAGVCQMGDCIIDWADCNQDEQDGCETHLGSIFNCADCGDRCLFENAEALCANGVCELGICDSGYRNCNEESSDGCEAQIGTAEHCGACGDACTFDNASGICNTDRVCEMGECDVGFADCNSDFSDGCEIELGGDQNCGSCGDDCTTKFDNATGECQEQACQMLECLAGFGDCDGRDNNGCEQSLTSERHCGECGNTCLQIEECTQEGGVFPCTSSCVDSDQDGYADVACGGSDCDDDEAGVNPGAEESCNNIDDDCNDEIDDGFDVDQDGYRDAAVCQGENLDCDDQDPDVNPGATEICADLIDNNCDGRADERCGSDDSSGCGCGLRTDGRTPSWLLLLGLLAGLSGVISRKD